MNIKEAKTQIRNTPPGASAASAGQRARTRAQVPHKGGRHRPRNERRPATFPLPTRPAGASAATESPQGAAI